MWLLGILFFNKCAIIPSYWGGEMHVSLDRVARYRQTDGLRPVGETHGHSEWHPVSLTAALKARLRTLS